MIASTILLNLSVVQAFGRSGGGVGVVSTPSDWQCGSIAAKLRQQIKPMLIPNPRVLGGFDLRQMRELFQNMSVSYALTLKSDGSADITLRQTSGSDAIDKKGIELIELAAPFRRIKGSIETYFVVLPDLLVTKDLIIPTVSK